MGLGKQLGQGLSHECGTKHGLKPFEQPDGTINGFCFSCGKWVKNPYGEDVKIEDLPPRKEKTPEQIQEEIDEILGYQTITVPQRKLRKDNLDHYEVKVAVSEQDGTTPTALFFPMKDGDNLKGFHVKMINPPDNFVKAYNIGDTKDIDMLGWDIAKKSGAYTLIITEGPEDMVSAYRIHQLGVDDPKWMPAVVSLPFGTNSAKKFISKHLDEIRKRFKKVILSFDDDESGHKAVKDAMLIIPEAVSVTLPYKDANECLMEGKAKEAYNAYRFLAEKPTNTQVVMGKDVYLKALEPAKFGELTWPWKDIQADMRGIRLGETTYFGGPTKAGKTTIKNALAAHFIQKDKVKVFMACPEEPNEMSYKLLANQITGKIFHDPNIEFDLDAFKEAGKVLDDNLYMLSLYQFLGWETLKKSIIYAVGEGCKVVMVDPITCLTNGINAADSNTFLQGFAQELSQMAKDMNFHAFTFCHLKTPEGNLSEEKREQYYKKGQYRDLGPITHEFGGSVYSNQFAGSRGMQRSAHLMLGLMCNKDPDLDEGVRDTRELVVLEDRNWNNNSKYLLYYNRNTGLFQELGHG